MIMGLYTNGVLTVKGDIQEVGGRSKIIGVCVDSYFLFLKEGDKVEMSSRGFEILKLKRELLIERIRRC
jgi:hypothetical protein